jgi:DnaJ-class molecular chaperone
MSEAEALEVLGLGPGATEADITESHRRLMQLIHPDRGGSSYFAVKANQAKEVLLGRDKSQNGRSAGAGARKRRRHASQQDLSQSKPPTRG